MSECPRDAAARHERHGLRRIRGKHMSGKRVNTFVGTILIVVGGILLAGSIAEAPKVSRSEPNRFYSRGESEQFASDAQFLKAKALSAMNMAMAGQPARSPFDLPAIPDLREQNDGISEAAESNPKSLDSSSEHSSDFDDVVARYYAGKKAQDLAYAKQKQLSQGLRVSGLVALTIAAVVLLVARRQQQLSFRDRDAA